MAGIFNISLSFETLLLSERAFHIKFHYPQRSRVTKGALIVSLFYVYRALNVEKVVIRSITLSGCTS
jgi:hypothetical protein